MTMCGGDYAVTHVCVVIVSLLCYNLGISCNALEIFEPIQILCEETHVINKYTHLIVF